MAASSEILLKGYLTKRGAVVKNWQIRYFVLEYGRLTYYTDARVWRFFVPHRWLPFFLFFNKKKNWHAHLFKFTVFFSWQQCKSKKGQIPLGQVTAVSVSPPEQSWGKANCFKIVTPQRTFYMYCEKVSDRDLWVSLVQSQSPNCIARLSVSHREPTKTTPRTSDLASECDTSSHADLRTHQVNPADLLVETIAQNKRFSLQVFPELFPQNKIGRASCRERV